MTYQFPSVHRATSFGISAVQPADPFVTRLSSVIPLTPDQSRIVSAMQGPPRRMPARTQLVRVGDSLTTTYVIQEGWAFAFTLLANGERQVVGFLLPGDIVALGCSAGANSELGVETITDTVATEISPASVSDAANAWPGVFSLFLRHQSTVLLGLVGHLTDIGRRDARARIAQLLLKLERRLAPIGHTQHDGYDCPISQPLIADALGLTSIHVNRVLRTLREDGVATLRNNRVTIHDRVRLLAIAGDTDEIDTGATASVVPMNRHRDGRPAMGRDNSRVA
jgi:CRP-like cAMP-binding protein